MPGETRVPGCNNPFTRSIHIPPQHVVACLTKAPIYTHRTGLTPNAVVLHGLNSEWVAPTINALPH